ncbi:MAG: hypothetical protein JOZ75_10510, partial [Candidatus Dormibacteraeota bacterium]|nr:hypothetical protein [Candidatus Dormibacteraeota bacterium]
MGAGRRVVLLLPLLASLVLAACASSAAAREAPRAAPASSRTAAPHGPLLAGTVQTSEDVTLDTAFHAGLDAAVSGAALTSPPAPSCASYAASPGGVFFPPEFDVVAADHSLYFSATAQSYQ